MEYSVFGRTGLTASRTGFGGIPIQRVSYEESNVLLRRAYEGGVNLFDTANGYTTSEDRIGTALSLTYGSARKNIILCTKSGAKTPEKLSENLDNSLKKMRTDYIDVLQFHNPGFVPKPGGGDGLYDCAVKAKSQGKIRFIGITSHSRGRAYEAAASGLYDVLQYPLSYLSSPEELELIELCGKNNVGVLAMKGLCGGLLTNIKAAFAFLRQFKNVFPIWGLQKMSELEEFLDYEENPPQLDGETRKSIEADRKELSGSFCRSCGYCLPCPAGIPIPTAARLSFLMKRSVRENFVTDEWRQHMRNIDNCTGCGHCKEHCPYKLDTPELLKRQQKEYFENISVVK